MISGRRAALVAGILAAIGSLPGGYGIGGIDSGMKPSDESWKRKKWRKGASSGKNPVNVKMAIPKGRVK